MPRRSLHSLLIASIALGPLIVLGGCGGSDSGTQVKVDKEKEKAVLNAMGNYMKKQEAKTKGKTRSNQ